MEGIDIMEYFYTIDDVLADVILRLKRGVRQAYQTNTMLSDRFMREILRKLDHLQDVINELKVILVVHGL